MLLVINLLQVYFWTYAKEIVNSNQVPLRLTIIYNKYDLSDIDHNMKSIPHL